MTEQQKETSIMKRTSVLHMTNNETHVTVNGTERILTSLVVAAGMLLYHNACAQEISLGTDDNFAVLAASTITSTGATVTGGDVGLYAGTSVTGFPPATIAAPYSLQVANGVALQAQNDLTTAYNAAAGLAPTGGNLSGQDLGGMILTPGVYFFSSSAELTGTLTFNDLGNLDAVFVFQIGSTLTTASGSQIDLDGAQASDIFWQVGSSATIGTGSSFDGIVMADESITLTTGSTVDGRLLAENGAVTLDGNVNVPIEQITSSVPDTGGTLLLLGFGVAALFAFGRRFCHSTQWQKSNLQYG
jgi:hypothetical protein